MLALIFILFALAVSAAASSTTIIYAFAGGKDGEYLDTDLVVDAAGNIYGTSVQGGDFSSGTVWELSPSANGWTHTVLYSFHGGRDGSEPYKGVTLDAQGNLYGTTVAGGSGACDGGCGVVYKISNEGGLWVETVIHSFTGGLDGSGPGTGVTFDPRGNLYGMTPTGGAFGLGTIYELQPQTGGWKFRLIHAFTGGDDGASASAGRLTLDGKGNLYGVTTVGGANGDGVVFEVTRGDTGWTLIPLYAFQDQPDGALPYGGVIFDKAGNLYGATYYAGVGDVGAVYELSPSSGGWTETVLYSFAGGTDGSSPISTLAADKAGNLYGTTSAGGAPCGCGVIFKMTRKGASDWTESVVYRFPGAPGLSVAYNGMAAAADGSFYGATVSGGPANDGAIYRFVP
ncbi:MAG TPA: choice-of-anchor tandem repeat GloVer-containing protein [Candidatus Binatia bacterium]|nr:choice-of-anchor tandem repeat GloVer-containing protein [Candidatus Binatia bacterium]